VWLQVRGGPLERSAEIAGTARPAMQRFFCAIDAVEYAEPPDDDLIRAFVELDTAGLTSRHRKIVCAQARSRLSHSFSFEPDLRRRSGY
jgi:hypothetical protein